MIAVLGRGAGHVLGEWQRTDGFAAIPAILASGAKPVIGRIRFWGVLGGLLVVLSGIDLIALAAVIVTLGQLSANNDEVTFAFDGAFRGISMSYVALKIFQDVVGIAAGIIFLRPRLWPIST